MTFDEILSSIGSPEDQEAAKQLVSKYPALNQAVMRQEEFSRKMDGFRDVVEYAKQWDTWSEQYWDEQAGATKAEVALKQRITELQTQKDNEVTFEQLNAELTKKGFVDQKTLAEKEQALNEEFKGTAYVAAKLAEFGGRHVLDFKQPFKAEDFLKELPKLGTSDLERAYSMFTEAPRKEREEAKRKEELDEIRKNAVEEGYKKAVGEVLEKTRGGSIVPTDDGTNEPGSLQQKLYGAPVTDDSPELGRGLAQYTARKYREEQLQSR